MKKKSGGTRGLELQQAKTPKPSRESLDKYIVSKPASQMSPSQKITARKLNPNKNILCCICNQPGVLRPRSDKGRMIYYFAHGKANGKEIRHQVSSLDASRMAYCKEHDRKHQLLLTNHTR